MEVRVFDNTTSLLQLFITFSSWVVPAFVMFRLVELTVTLLYVSRSSWTNSNNACNYGLSLLHLIVNMYLPHLIIQETGSLNDALEARIRAYSNGGRPWPQNQSRHEAHLQGMFCFTRKQSDDFPVRGSLLLAASSRHHMLGHKVIQSMRINNSRLNERELIAPHKRRGAQAWTAESIQQVEGLRVRVPSHHIVRGHWYQGPLDFGSQYYICVLLINMNLMIYIYCIK